MGEDDRAKRTVVFTNLFAEQLHEVFSKTAYQKIRRRILTLAQFPSIGSPIPRASLVERFGSGIRISPVAGFVIIYRENDDSIELLALVFGPTIV